MKEIEILISFDDQKETVLKKLSKFQFIEEKEIQDIYYVDELRENLKPEPNLRLNELFRLRKKGNDCLITYKKQHFEGNRWIYSDEYETNATDYETIKKIIEMLGLKELVNIHNQRKIYKFEDYEIVFEDVTNLGYFIEVERMLEQNDKKDVLEVKEQIKEFIKSLGLTNVKELDYGKNQLMLIKNLNRTDINIYIE